MAIAPELLTRYKQVFFPHNANTTRRVQGEGGRFAYYTTAATAMLILQRCELWMRSTMVMNDFSEVQHGLSCITKAYRSEAGLRLTRLLDQLYSGLPAEIEQTLNDWTPSFRDDTFVLCLSEHTHDDDRFGRLSMWRAYGGDAGVALVVNGGAMFRESTALAVYSMPVAYLDEGTLQREFQLIVDAIELNVDLLQLIGRAETKNAIFHMLRYAAVCTKHPAFAEEREWRVIASPSMEPSPLVPVQLEVIGGIPQRVLKLALKDRPDLGLTGLEPNQLIDRVLIGPCEHSEVIGQALWGALGAAGVADAGNKIFYTGIPLRANQR